MFKLFSIILILSYSSLFAHCDGCGTEEHNSNGTLMGNVKYKGSLPSSTPTLNRTMNSNPYCGAYHTDKVFSEKLIVDADYNLKNVLVWLKDVNYEGETTKRLL